MTENSTVREAQSTGDYVEAVTPRLLKRMDKATEDQERQLDAVYSGVKRLHNAAVATNDEVVSQNGMLDDVSIQINSTESAVQQQTVAARKVVSAHRKLFCYYVIILLLAAALLIVILV